MTTPDTAELLREALHQEADSMTITDSQQAAARLNDSMHANRRRRTVLLAAAAAAAAVVTAVGAGVLVTGEDRAAPAPVSPGPTLPAPGHRIVFGADEKVFLVSDRGGKPVEVLLGKDPRFAPGGAQVAYVDGGGHLAVAAVASRGPWEADRLDAPPAERADGAPGLAGPVWSPDGRRIAYLANSELRTVDIATGQVQALREFRAPYVRPMDWTPDGSALVLGFDRSTTGGEMVVELFDLATGRLTPFLDGYGETTGVRFSPDGTQIAFYSDSRRCICVAAADGSNIRPVLDLDALSSYPDSARVVWSPDGRSLVWDVRRGVQVSRLDLMTGENEVLAEDDGVDRTGGLDWDRP